MSNRYCSALRHGKIGNFCSIFLWLGALVIYASLVFMGARLKSLIVTYLFLEHCPSQGEDGFLLTFIDFFTHVRA